MNTAVEGTRCEILLSRHDSQRDNKTVGHGSAAEFWGVRLDMPTAARGVRERD